MQQQYENSTYCLRDRPHRDRCCSRHDNHHYRTTTTPPTPITSENTSDVPETTILTTTDFTTSNVDSHQIYPHFYRTFTSRLDLVDHLRIHRTETSKLVPETPTYTRAPAPTICNDHADPVPAWVSMLA
ncbi:hypothetical protein SprV_0401446100 [Sparganum proliferum]